MSEDPPPSPQGEGPGVESRSRLDPDLAAATAPRKSTPQPPGRRPEDVDTRRYRWAIGIFGLVLVVVLAVVGFLRNGVGSPGIAPGKPLHRFIAPLATGGLDLDANANPRCDPGHANVRGLNVCGRSPLVLAFFVTGSGSCLRQVDALQRVSVEPAFRSVQFAAVAIRSGRQAALKDVRNRGWTIPVAYDRDGSIGDLYGVEICPLVELADRGGVVARRLIGEHWSDPAALASAARVLVPPR